MVVVEPTRDISRRRLAVGGENMGQFGQRHDVELEHAHLLARLSTKSPKTPEAGVVDQDIDGESSGFTTSAYRFRADAGAGEVHRDDMAVRAMRPFQFGGEPSRIGSLRRRATSTGWRARRRCAKSAAKPLEAPVTSPLVHYRSGCRPSIAASLPGWRPPASAALGPYWRGPDRRRRSASSLAASAPPAFACAPAACQAAECARPPP